MVREETNTDPIDPISPLDSPNVGPAGNVGTWSGCGSNLGYIAPVSALSQGEFHFRRQPDGQPVSIQFRYDQKLVYYSTIPQDAFPYGDANFGCPDPVESLNKLFANTSWKIATESCCEATTYYLWNAATNTPDTPIVNGESYCINYKYNIEARVSCQTLPVGMKIWPEGGSTIARQKEYEAPYFLWGNNAADVLPNKKPLPAGVYHLSNLDGGDKITFTQTCAI